MTDNVRTQTCPCCGERRTVMTMRVETRAGSFTMRPPEGDVMRAPCFECRRSGRDHR